MEQRPFGIETKKFKTPEEEVLYLREQIARTESEIKGRGEELNPEDLVAQSLEQYKEVDPKEVLHRDFALKKKEAEAIVLELAPEEHDAKIEELIGHLHEKGIKNTLTILGKLNDSHLEDDFHRFLIQYVKAGFPVEGLAERSPLFRSLHMTLYEVSLPEAGPQETEKNLKQLISGMEQFYAGMLSVSAEDRKIENYFSLEIANANHSSEFVFYAAVPDTRCELFEKQILSIFHTAKIREVKDDYNIFNERGVAVGSCAASSNNPIFPLKTYDEFDVDPLTVLLNSFSKIDKDGEGAAIQFIFSPVQDFYVKKYQHALSQIQKGVPVKKAIDIPLSVWGDMLKGVRELLAPDKKKKPEETGRVDEVALEQIKNKIGSPILSCNIRIIVSSNTRREAEDILNDLEAAFNQFENTHGNKLRWKKLERVALSKLLREFAFRLFNHKESIPLSIKELTTMMHFPATHLKGAPQLKQSKAGSAAAPLDLPKEGTLLGINRNRNIETRAYIPKEDRLRHFYAIGQTGTGKTTLLKNMISQDIANGDGVCMIDPHGVDIQDILAVIPPNRYEDVIYFDPSNTERPMALNMLEYDRRFPEQKTFVVNEMLSIFDKLFDMKTAGGPMFEQYFRNSVMLTIEDPDSGSTLLDVSRVLSNKAFRELKLSHCQNPIVVQFWKEVAEKAGGEASLANIVPYITSKFDNFLSNDIMRPIIAQEKSSFNFREIMDSRKILLVNLAKGRLGDINSHLIGLILVGKILMAALSRVDAYGTEMPDFYLYIDEFQNITTNSIATILSEARKYRLGLNIAHQFIAQLEDKIKDAVFGNVGSIAAFRVGSEDAEFLEKQFAPVFAAQDIQNLDNRNAYVKLLIDGRPVKPFNIETLPPPQGNRDNIGRLKELSYLKFGRPRAEVEAEILKKYQK